MAATATDHTIFLPFVARERHARALPKPALPGYTTLDARVGGRAPQGLEPSLGGRNLFGPQHPELVTTNRLHEQVHRTCGIKLTGRP